MTQQATEPKPELRKQAGKYLTFRLAGEEYGLEILKVREIIGMQSPTPVPKAAKHFRGVINLRGKVVPVVDLRVKFDLPAVEATKLTAIVVAQVGGTEIGLIVDEVRDVLNVSAEQLEETPSLVGGLDVSFILALAKTSHGVVILLDLAKILNVHELTDDSAS